MNRSPRTRGFQAPAPGSHRRTRWWPTWFLILAIAPGLHAAQGGDAYFELGSGFKSGDFGTAVRSDLFYVAPSAGYVAPRYDFSATVPYLRLTTQSPAASGTESGLGDIVVRAGAVLFPDGSRDLSMYGALALKLPTADEARSLGTGETDVGVFLSARRRVRGMQLNLQGGYIKTGLAHMDGDRLRDVLLYGAGVSAVTGRSHVYVALDGRTPLVQGARSPLEIGIGGLHPLGTRYWLRGSAFAGLNEGGPAFGVGMGMVRVF